MEGEGFRTYSKRQLRNYMRRKDSTVDKIVRCGTDDNDEPVYARVIKPPQLFINIFCAYGHACNFKDYRQYPRNIIVK